MNSPTFVCPCCGYDGLHCAPYLEMRAVADSETSRVEPPYVVTYGEASYDVCECCGFEFGFDDEPGNGQPESFRSYRREWIQEGCEWFYPQKKPEGWTLAQQLRNLGISPDDATHS